MNDQPNPDADLEEPLRPMPLGGSTKPSLHERMGPLLIVVVGGAMIATLVIGWRMMSGG